MKEIERIIEQNQVFRREKIPSATAKLRGEVESFNRQLDRLSELETFLKEKYRKKLDNLTAQLNSAEGTQSELKVLVKELNRDKEMRSTLDKKIIDLKKSKEILRQTIKQVKKYKETSDKQIDILKTEREALYLRIQELVELLDLAEQTELTEKELNTICQRIYTRKELLAEIEIGLRKRTIDLLFESYIPPRTKNSEL